MKRRLATIALIFAFAQPGDVEACGWDWESYHAEQKSLPCVHDALLGYWPKHSREYHGAKLAAADSALRWVPGWTDGLDAKGVALLHLGRLDEAGEVMKQRHAIAPAAYASHANLGTLYTFTGQFDEALALIDEAMAIEPEAHFGREKYHRDLVVFLQKLAADPGLGERENFLGLEMSEYQRLHGSKAVFAELGLDEDGFDALVSMLTVYGADGVAEIYLTLGELLAARGHRRLAYTAYRRARELDHPRSDELRRWMRQIHEQLRTERRADVPRGAPFGYRGISERYTTTTRKAKAFVEDWQAWEREQIAAGLEIWTQAGLDVIYARMHEQRRRCDAPRIINDDQAPLADDDRPVDESDDSELEP